MAHIIDIAARSANSPVFLTSVTINTGGNLASWPYRPAGLSDKQVDVLRMAEQRFRFKREWTPQPLTDLIQGRCK